MQVGEVELGVKTAGALQGDVLRNWTIYSYWLRLCYRQLLNSTQVGADNIGVGENMALQSKVLMFKPQVLQVHLLLLQLRLAPKLMKVGARSTWGENAWGIAGDVLAYRSKYWYFYRNSYYSH